MQVRSVGGGRKCDALGSKFNCSRVRLAFSRGIETGVNNEKRAGNRYDPGALFRVASGVDVCGANDFYQKVSLPLLARAMQGSKKKRNFDTLLHSHAAPSDGV
jgi:hypothetical protein